MPTTDCSRNAQETSASQKRKTITSSPSKSNANVTVCDDPDYDVVNPAFHQYMALKKAENNGGVFVAQSPGDETAKPADDGYLDPICDAGSALH